MCMNYTRERAFTIAFISTSGVGVIQDDHIGLIAFYLSRCEEMASCGADILRPSGVPPPPLHLYERPPPPPLLGTADRNIKDTFYHYYLLITVSYSQTITLGSHGDRLRRAQQIKTDKQSKAWLKQKGPPGAPDESVVGVDHRKSTLARGSR